MKQNITKTLVLFLISFLPTFTWAQRPGAYTALDLDGANDYVLLTDNSALNPTSSITVEAWVKADSYGPNSWSNSILCKHGWASGNAGYVLRCGDNGKLSFNISNASGTWLEAISGSVMKTGNWYHVAGTFNGDSICVYINGNLEAVYSYSGSITPSTGLNPRIGDLANNGGRFFDGQIDEVRIWRSALSKATIRNWMCRKVSKSHPNYSTLSGYWKLDEGTSSTANDNSSNSGTGTLYNGPSWVISGAAIGDTSSFSYGTNSSSLTTKFGDVFTAKNITGSPNTFHTFAVYDTTEQIADSKIYGKIDSTHYFGVYYETNSSVKFDVNYNYKNLNTINSSNECGLDMFSKSPGYQGKWGYSPSKLFTAGDSVVVYDQVKSDFIMGLFETDTNKLISTPTGKPWFCGKDSILLTAAGNDSCNYVWYKDGSIISGKTGQSLWVSTVGKYKVKINRNSTSCSFMSATLDISNRNKPSASLSSFTGVCENKDTLILRGGSPSGGKYSGTGVKQDSMFFPKITKAGKYTITYTYTDTSLCDGTASQILEIFGLPKFTKSAPLEYCNHNDSLDLTLVNPKGGKYTGKYISNNKLYLNSSIYKIGFYPFNYEFTDANKCSNILRDSFLVKQSTACFLGTLPDFCLQDAPVTLTGFPSSGIFSGKGVTGDKFEASQAGSGKHLIKYEYTNTNKCTTTDSQIVTVFNNTNVSWKYSLKTCQNADSIKLPEGTPTGGFFTGKGVSSSGYFNPKTAGSGIHKLYYNVTDANGCKNKASNDVTLSDTTKLTVTQPSPLCPDAFAVNLQSVSPSGGVYSGTGVSSNTFYPTIAGLGKHSISYLFTNTGACVSKTYFDMEVSKTDSISISIKDKTCIYDEPIAIKMHPIGGILKGDGILGGNFYPSFAGEGMHWITYTFMDSHQCNIKDSTFIYVAQKPSVSLNPFNSVCNNIPDLILSGGLPTDSGTYYFNGIPTSVFSPKSNGKGLYKIEYKVVNHYGCRDSAFQNIRVNLAPVKPNITITGNILESSSASGNQWLDLNGTIVGATQQTFKPTLDGKYRVLVTNDSNCFEISDTILFKKVNVKQIVNSGISIYPNPSKDGYFYFENIPANAFVTLSDMQGRILQKLELNNGLWDLRQFANGTYILCVEGDTGKVYLKICVQQ